MMPARMRAATFAFCMGVCLLFTAGASSQEPVAPRWFQIGIPEVDQSASQAIDRLSSGMSQIILALNDGRKSKTPVDKKMAGEALENLASARKELEGISGKIGGRKINVDIIRAAGYGKAFDALVSNLKQLGYSEPVDGKSFVLLITSVIDRSIKDLQVLIDNKGGSALVQEAFLDLVAQKMLLEQLGSTAGIITTSMQ
jgi:hypothetical protein